MLKAIFSKKGNFITGNCVKLKKFNGIRIAPFKNNALAAISISADFELNWAFRAHRSEDRDSKGRISRTNIEYLLELFKIHNVPVTWAIVGHLFLESCEKGKNGLAHANMPRPLRNDRWNGDWYMHDPCTNMAKDPLWYAPDLINKIIDNKISHEIGTHSFSHIDFTPSCSSPQLVRSEIDECLTVMKPFIDKPKTLVYPFNNMGHSYLNLISKMGIICVRHRDKKVRLCYPERTDSGVYKIFESMNTRSSQYYDYFVKAKIFIEEAMKRNAAYHIWFHPSDPPNIFRNEFRRIIEYISEKRNEGKIWIATMSELTAYCEAREMLSLNVDKNDKEISIIFDAKLNIERFGEPEITIIIPVKKWSKDIFLKNDKGVKKLNLKKSYYDADKSEMIVNVPITAHSIRLIY